MQVLAGTRARCPRGCWRGRGASSQSSGECSQPGEGPSKDLLRDCELCRWFDSSSSCNYDIVRCSEGGGRGELRIDSRSSSLNVSALVGKQAVLACTVTNINNHSVGHQSLFILIGVLITNHSPSFKKMGQILHNMLTMHRKWNAAP